MVELQEERKVPSKEEMLREIGVAGPSIFATYNEEEMLNLSEVKLDDLQRMCRIDGQARALYNILTLPIVGSRWYVREDQGGKEEAEFINECLSLPPARGGMSTPMTYVLAVVASAVRDGFKVFEKCYKLDQKGRVIFKKWAPRPSETLRILVDETGGFNGVRQQTTFRGRSIDVKIPREKCILFSVGKEDNRLYGIPLLLPGYYHFDKKHKLYYIAHLAYAINAVALRLGEIPPGSDEAVVQAFRQALGSLGFNTSMTFPQGFKVTSLEMQRALADFKPLIDHHDSMMAKSVLAQFIDLGTQGRGGAYALSEDQSDFFVMAFQALKADIVETINSYGFTELIDWNFGSGRYPMFGFEPFDSGQKKVLVETFKAIMTSQVNKVTPEFLWELEKSVAAEFGFEIDYDALAERVKAEEEEKAKAQLEAKNLVQQALSKLAQSPERSAMTVMSELAEEVRTALEIVGQRRR